MFKSDDDMVECPYNKSHLMLRKRLQSHLLKCRIHYPDVELMKCPFNATHHVPEPEFTYHATNCPDRKLITQYKYDAPEQKQEEIPFHAPIESEDNWDDTDVPDYDPTKYSETAAIIRLPDGPTPSERKEFIKKERKRLGDGDSDDDEPNEVSLQQVPVVQAVQQYQNDDITLYDGNNRKRSRSPLSISHRSRSPRSKSPRTRTPNEGSRRPSSSYRERRHRDRSPPTPPSPPVYSASSLRERSSYNMDDDPYYSHRTERASFSDSKSQRHNRRNDSYSEHERGASRSDSRSRHYNKSKDSEEDRDYYSHRTERASFSDSKSQRNNRRNDSYSEHERGASRSDSRSRHYNKSKDSEEDRDYYNRGSRRSRI